jgi:hypothetical protein
MGLGGMIYLPLSIMIVPVIYKQATLQSLLQQITAGTASQRDLRGMVLR